MPQLEQKVLSGKLSAPQAGHWIRSSTAGLGAGTGSGSVTGGGGDSAICGSAKDAPQLSQNASPGMVGTWHCGQTSAPAGAGDAIAKAGAELGALLSRLAPHWSQKTASSGRSTLQLGQTIAMIFSPHLIFFNQYIVNYIHGQLARLVT
jgi:hypothetical protein